MSGLEVPFLGLSNSLSCPTGCPVVSSVSKISLNSCLDELFECWLCHSSALKVSSFFDRYLMLLSGLRFTIGA